MIIVMIVYVMKGDCEWCFEVGMDEYIVKLIWVYVLIEKLWVIGLDKIVRLVFVSFDEDV